MHKRWEERTLRLASDIAENENQMSPKCAPKKEFSNREIPSSIFDVYVAIDYVASARVMAVRVCTIGNRFASSVLQLSSF